MPDRKLLGVGETSSRFGKSVNKSTARMVRKSGAVLRLSRRDRSTKSKGKKNEKPKKPYIVICGREANPLPLSRKSIALSAVGANLSEGGMSDGKWAEPQVKHPEPFEVLGLGEMDPEQEFAESELESAVPVKITESATIDLFFKPSLVISNAPENEDVREFEKARKLDFESSKQKHTEQADKYQFRAAQTQNSILRTKYVQCSGPQTREMGCQASSYDIYDAHNPTVEQPKRLIAGLRPNKPAEAKGGVAVGVPETNSSVGSNSLTSTMHNMHISRAAQHSMAISTMGRSLFTGNQTTLTGGSVAIHNYSMYSHVERSHVGVGTDGQEMKPEDIYLANLLQFEDFRVAVETVERAVINNAMHEKQTEYRAEAGALGEVMKFIKSRESKAKAKAKAKAKLAKAKQNENLETTSAEAPLSRPGTSDGTGSGSGSPTEEILRPQLNLLWNYQSPLTVGRNVSCLAFNPKNPDLLAVGYGSFDFDTKDKGYILFWSIKNPHYPCKKIEIATGVTSLDFSQESPNLLAVGLYNGSLAIYDIREPGSEPALKSVHEKSKKSKHSEPVWGVKWIYTGGPGTQLLTSISTDGAVLLWNLKKGLEPKQIMQLKRITNTEVLQGSSKVDVISRQASALCIDFFQNDKTQQIYVAGTEGGIVHKCSVLYSEQTLENYMAHTGPIYSIKCNPFTDLFLTSSADETIGLWDHKSTAPVLKFKKDRDAVQGLAWAPFDSCVFASVSRDSSLKVWDLSSNTMLPIVQETVRPWSRPEGENKHQQTEQKTVISRSESPGLMARDDTGVGSPSSPNAKDAVDSIRPPELTCVAFAPESPVVIVGGKDGIVRVYRITNVGCMKNANLSAEQQADRLMDAVGIEIKSDD
eukprot:CAMPEP_0197518930 /NCGR_PEP_ID=MMETSP1318-20131121/4188_1 /TAXON_ID=552666 /ORGANISM="Partenskyella glossopodia, Strain RCC365" /LENGTH=870 /DNA_ID=CAMNT_0043069635 /DNA_START=47 /DNA_END=2659 /DNA_ORIENTATION=-